MTQEEIIEGNKLIIKFMGFTAYKLKRNGLFGKKEMTYYYGKKTFWSELFFICYFKFHSSWDWLMPVCIKLGMIFVDTDIVLTYKSVLNGIRNLE